MSESYPEYHAYEFLPRGALIQEISDLRALLRQAGEALEAAQKNNFQADCHCDRCEPTHDLIGWALAAIREAGVMGAAEEGDDE